MTDHDPQLVSRLDELEAKLPRILGEFPDDADFWPVFAGEADAILEGLPAEPYAYALGRVDCMLRNQGLIPGEEEGNACS